jgi:hypothetical protein
MDSPVLTAPPDAVPAPSRHKAHQHDLWDRLGIGLSGLCMVHCLLLPVLLSLLPLWPALDAAHRWLHPIFAGFIVPTTLFAMVSGYRRHGRRDIPVWLGAGLCIVLAGWLAHEGLGTLGETVVTIIGSLLLIVGHGKNWQVNRHCKVHVPA